ncbi:Manganese-dependent protein-tyrosine phosphatase [hydrothermal vent metagenome]|uniref:Manganese-dependent protein-tyrosine phosphatase n=1 Tax=hydrothermal vent metagenome TaxID=652676 RepID=A0A3B0ZAH2_9ZZZZ
MIDIHSHILPGVDDGAQNVADAIEMLRIAADGGVTHQVLTPHIHLNRFDNNITQLKEHFEVFQEVVEDKGISIKLHLAAEIHIDPNIIQMVESDTLP